MFNLNRQPCPPNEREGVDAILAIDLSWDRGDGENKNGQHGYIIGPSWVLLRARYSCKTGFTTRHIYLKLLFCNWERQIKPKYFPIDTCLTVIVDFKKSVLGIFGLLKVHY
jgi:hypothetical protein